MFVAHLPRNSAKTTTLRRIVMTTRIRPERQRISALAGLGAVALVLLLAPVSAGAIPGSATDPDDVPLPLDLKTVSHADDASSVTFTVETYEDFPNDVADFKWGIDTNGDESFDLIVFGEWDGSALIAGVDDTAENQLAEGTISRPAPNAIRVSIPLNVLGKVASFRYGATAITDLNDNGEADAGEQDLAPNTGLYQYKLGSTAPAPAPANGSSPAPVAAPSAVQPAAPPPRSPSGAGASPPALVTGHPTPVAPAPAEPIVASPAPNAPGVAAPAPSAPGALRQGMRQPSAAPAAAGTPASAVPAAAPPPALARTGTGSVWLAVIAGAAFVVGGLMFMLEGFMTPARQ
jgi:hypothetical protein